MQIAPSSSSKLTPFDSKESKLDISRPSQRLAAEASLMKLPDQSSLFHSSANIITKSAVTFHDIKEEAVKDSFKKNKQAWETPPETTLSSRIQLPSTIHQTGSKKIQDFLYPEHLQQLRKKFETLPDFMNSTFDLDHFIEFFHTIPELKGKSDAEIKVFFDKIDCYSSGRINWDEFCTYMHLELYEREDAKIKAKEVVFNQPSSLLKSGPHKETICSISHLPDGSLVSCSEDGIICIWSHDFKPKRIRKTEVGVLGKPKWISDMVLAVPQGKIILATGDKEILFMELVNFEPYCQIVNLDSTPLKMDFWSDPNNKNECILIIGDEQGAVTIFCISSLFEFFKMLKLSPKKNGIPSFSVENFINKGDEPSVPGTKVYRWSLHANWVSSIKYCGKLRVFISTSNDPNTSLVMGTPSGSTPVDAILGSQYNRRISNKKYNIYSRQNTVYGNMPNTRSGNASIIAKKRLPGDQRVFKVTKGITTFDYCHINNVLVTGGMDQVIHIWNPFVNEKPIGSLYGQGSPLFHVQIDSPYNRIYSISNDNTVKVWDIVEYTCLATVTSICHKVYSTIEALHFNPIKQYLVLGTDQLHVLHLISLGNSNIHQYYITHTHRQPVTAIAYSQLFNLLITACEESVIKVWNLATGENIFEFASVHDNSPISAIDIDPTGRRLLTAAQNGEIKMWNYNNGHCLLKLDKGNNYEVTDIKFVSVNQLKYVIAVGWDRKLSVFFDSFEPGNVYTSITPVDGWKMSSGHSDDMTCVVQCTPTTLATASYDGEIIMWNILSGQITRRFKAPLNNNQLKSISPKKGDCLIRRLIYLDKRSKLTGAASLIASGPGGYVHFWNIYNTKTPMGLFQASQYKCISDMVVNTANSLLVVSDIEGFVSVWDIKSYCMDKKNIINSKCMMKWRAHTQCITKMSLIETWNVVVTGSKDNSVRIWTLGGCYIGTLGQQDYWNIEDTSTYQHPIGPKDVLVDPALSVPDLKVGESSMESEMGEPENEMVLISDIETSEPDEEDKKIDEEILSTYGLSLSLPNSSSISEGGKRLRHFRTNSAKIKASVYTPPPGSYSSLLYQDLDDDNYHPINNIKTLKH